MKRAASVVKPVGLPQTLGDVSSYKHLTLAIAAVILGVALTGSISSHASWQAPALKKSSLAASGQTANAFPPLPVCPPDESNPGRAGTGAPGPSQPPSAGSPGSRLSTPTIRLAPSSDTGVSNSDQLTGNNAPTFEGQAQAGSQIGLFDGATLIAVGDTDSQGNWSIAPDICQALTDGTHPIAAQAANEAGQFSPRSAAIVITIDTNPPAMPVISSPGNNSVIQGGKLTITGKGDPNSIVKVLERAAIRSQTRASGGGAWSVSLSGLASGPHTFRASAVDAAGNESPAFNAITIVVNGAASTPAGTVGGANTSPGSVGLSSVKQGSFPRAVNVKRTRTPTPTATATAVTTPLPTITATPVPSNTPTATPLSSATPTATLLPTNTPTPTPLPSSTPTAPATATAIPSPTPAAAVVAMASGDIACGTGSVGNCQQLATSNLLINGNPDVVLPLGDNQYECGALGDFSSFYNPSWGRLLGKTHPTIGNHEYLTSTDPTQPCFNAPTGAPGYFTYFGNAATPNQPGCTSNCGGYYSFNIGAWHIVVLNSVCSQVGGCGLGSPEETWLKNDLAANPTVCTLAYWHYPRYTSGLSGTTFVTGLKTFWQDLYNGGVDIILNGHDHDYERFAPMDVNGNVDTAHGIREFVIGTGGKNLTGFTTSAANSEVWNNNTFGVQKLTLSDGSYAWQFLPISGQTFSDSGSESCR